MTTKGVASAKERELLSNPFFEINRMIEAQRVFNDFVKRVVEGTVKNDGTDELLSLIDNCVLGNDTVPFRKTLPRKTKLYRARVIGSGSVLKEKGIKLVDDQLCGYNESESREAPLGFATEGRNNIKGVSYFYASNKPSTACCEVKPVVRQLISVAEFIVEDTMHIVDFSTDKTLKENERISLDRLFADIMLLYYRPVSDYAEYKATQILTDYIRKTGVDGISYRSYFDATGVNYTIFNSDHRKLSFVKSSIYLFQSERNTFMDLNGEQVVQTESVGGAKYEPEVRNKMLANIRKTLSDNISPNKG